MGDARRPGGDALPDRATPASGSPSPGATPARRPARPAGSAACTRASCAARRRRSRPQLRPGRHLAVVPRRRLARRGRAATGRRCSTSRPGSRSSSPTGCRTCRRPTWRRWPRRCAGSAWRRGLAAGRAPTGGWRETQRRDGGWASDDGQAFDVHTTLTAIRAVPLTAAVADRVMPRRRWRQIRDRAAQPRSVAVAGHDVLGRGQLGQAHRAAGVQLLGARCRSPRRSRTRRRR